MKGKIEYTGNEFSLRATHMLLLRGCGYTLQEVAEFYDLSRERVRQIIKRAEETIRNFYEGFEEYGRWTQKQIEFIAENYGESEIPTEYKEFRSAV